MQAYTISYRHSKGVFVSTKWAEGPGAALMLVKRVHQRVHLSAAVGAIAYDKAQLINPQPFSDESRSARGRLTGSIPATAAPPPVEIDFSLCEGTEPVAMEESPEVAPETGDEEEAA